MQCEQRWLHQKSMNLHISCKFMPFRQKRLSLVTVTRRYLCHSRPKTFDSHRFRFKLALNMEKQLKKKKIRNMAHVDKYKSKLSQVPVSFSASVTVVSTGANGLGRSVLLRTNTDRYLFNCGETVQKVMPDISSRLGPVDNIFFTYNTWNNVGGIMGFLLSNTEDIYHANTIVLHGPPYVNKLLDMTRMFSENHVGSLAKVDWHGIDRVKHEDDQLTVEYVELRSGESEEIQKVYQFENKCMDKKKTVMNYIIRLKAIPRKVDSKKLLSLNTKSGPWIKKLVDGEEVTLPDGRTVKPDDVLFEKDKDLGPIVVVDCPTEDYLDSLSTNKQLLDLQTETDSKPLMIIHMAPATIIEEPRYKAFMDRHQSGTIHLMLNENSPGPYLHSSQQYHSALNYLDPELFPALQGHFHYTKRPEPATGSVVQACYGLTYNIRPMSSRGFNWEELLYLNQEEFFAEVKRRAKVDALGMIKKVTCEDKVANLMNFKESDIDDEVMKLRSLLKQQRKEAADQTEEYPEIVFLGTGSAKPALTRNASAILIQMRKDEYFLMDCGEGTLTQLYQMYGLEKTHHILSNLKAMFISHLHFDHHGGMFGVLEARRKVISMAERSDRLTVFAPVPLKKWFNLFSTCVAPIESTIEMIPHHVIHEAVKSNKDSSYIARAKDVLGVSEFVVMPVVHTTNSFGISIRHRDGWKLVYSGDSMPCQELVRYGKDCDILIHEATFDDYGEEDAAFKRHSTTSQAIEVGRQMNAKFTLLTHFSQKYAKVPVFTENFTENVGFSFDFMQLRPSQLWLIHLLKPALKLMYGFNLETRLINLRKNLSLKSHREKAYLEKAVSEKRLADKAFLKKKRDSMEEWSEKGEDLKSKLLTIEQKTKLREQTKCDGNVEVKEDEEMEDGNVTEGSNKRKVETESVVNKSRKTDTDVCVATTSDSNGGFVEQDDTVIGSSYILEDSKTAVE
ncbi:zinc phosphodiesterase ELAC protein 2-like [Mercenaria mercenaria]|uniref:zinc phosphodiesterase ELAC protein 2-like n=1 Tax=Mercenaria mercenaria TaxID=6596 RepID=UPI00234F7738|nr:zinc phosphodiesterase ELAC protein 2-like [Mercenaria mercenaria]